MTVGDRIKYIREKKGIPQTELAEKMKVSKQTLYKYENNIVTNVPSDRIEKAAYYLNVNPGYLRGWEDNLIENNADLIPDILSDDILLEKIKKLMSLDKVHKQTIYDNIDFLYEKMGQN